MLVMYKVVLDVMGSSRELAGFGLSSSLSSAEILKNETLEEACGSAEDVCIFQDSV